MATGNFTAVPIPWNTDPTAFGIVPASGGTFTGDVGIGVTPAVWNAGVRALDLNTRGFTVGGGVDSGTMSVNAYMDLSSVWRYKGTSTYAVTRLDFFDGTFTFHNAVAGTAAAAITWNERLRISVSGVVTPGADNTQTLGSGPLRWSVVYAGTGTINTSDAREKTAVAPMSPNEIAAAKALAGEIGTFQFLDAIAKKGAEVARHHVGMTVQRAIQIMEAHDLDPERYGFICHDAWEETETSPAGDRYGFRPDELALFLARGFEARLAAAGL